MTPFLRERIVLTFDVERDWVPNVYASKPSFRMVERAFPLVARFLEAANLPSIFFVTGEVAKHLPELVCEMRDRRFSVGVHTHPCFHPEVFRGRHVNDKKWDVLTKYSLEEQLQMIGEDLDAVRECLGRSPKHFRAGKLASNRDTRRALAKLGFLVDSSKLSPPHLPVVFPPQVTDEGVLELPVAVVVTRRMLRMRGGVAALRACLSKLALYPVCVGVLCAHLSEFGLGDGEYLLSQLLSCFHRLVLC